MSLERVWYMMEMNVIGESVVHDGDECHWRVWYMMEMNVIGESLVHDGDECHWRECGTW